VPADDAFLAGRAVPELAIDYQLMPLRVQGAGQQTRPLDARLTVGDRLTAILALADLQRLLQRERGLSPIADGSPAKAPLA